MPRERRDREIEAVVSSHRGLTQRLSYGKINWIQAYSESPYMPNALCMVWKCVLALFGLGILAWSVATGPNVYWLIYLTHWMLLTHVVYLVFQAMVAANVHLRIGHDSDAWKEPRVPLFVRALWFCEQICLPGGLLVTIVYWTLLANGDSAAINYFAHALVWTACMIDFLLGMQPFVLVQAVWFIVWALVYAFWSLIHGKSGLTNGKDPTDPSYCTCIYTVLNWTTNAKSAAGLAFGLAIFAVPAACFAIWCTNFVRVQAVYVVNDDDLPHGGAIVAKKSSAAPEA